MILNSARIMTDWLLRIFKWPIAIFSLALLPSSLLALFSLSKIALLNFSDFFYFFSGFFVYALLWVMLFKKEFVGSFFSTLEHEITHSFFAFCTFHRVSGLRATWNEGGVVYVHGGTNWLISIAPYFFPTLSIGLMMIFHYLFIDLAVLQAFLGVTTAYHITSTIRETHSNQPDLKETGFLFAWCFLPTANICFWGIIMMFVLFPDQSLASFPSLVIDDAFDMFR